MISIPLTLAGTDGGEGALEAHRLGLELDAVLQVLEGVQREVEEVAGAAGGIEDGEGAQLFEEVAQGALGLAALARACGN